MLPRGFSDRILLFRVRDSSQDVGWERGDWEMSRGDYGGTGHKSIGIEALLALLLLEQRAARLLRLLCNQRCMEKENRKIIIVHYAILIRFPTILLFIVVFYEFV